MTAPGAPLRPAPRGLLRWCFEDRANGKLVIVQWPNWAIWIFLAALAVQYIIHPAGKLGTAATVVAAFALTWWALDELVRGSNPWRRALGAGALAYIVWRGWLLLAGAMH